MLNMQSMHDLCKICKICQWCISIGPTSLSCIFSLKDLHLLRGLDPSTCEHLKNAKDTRYANLSMVSIIGHSAHRMHRRHKSDSWHCCDSKLVNRAQLWKYCILGKQSVHCAAMTSLMYLHYKARPSDCVDVGHMRTCCWISHWK